MPFQGKGRGRKYIFPWAFIAIGQKGPKAFAINRVCEPISLKGKGNQGPHPIAQSNEQGSGDKV
jgi:hypothetical protein